MGSELGYHLVPGLVLWQCSPPWGFYPTQRYPSMRCGMSQTTLTKQTYHLVDIGIKHLRLLFHLFPSLGTQETDKRRKCIVFFCSLRWLHVEFLPLLGNTIQKQQGVSSFHNPSLIYFSQLVWKLLVSLPVWFSCLVSFAEIMSRVKKPQCVEHSQNKGPKM